MFCLLCFSQIFTNVCFPSSNGSDDEGFAEDGGEDAVYAPSFKESEENNNSRLAEIAAMSVDEEASEPAPASTEMARLRSRSSSPG